MASNTNINPAQPTINKSATNIEFQIYQMDETCSKSFFLYTIYKNEIKTTYKVMCYIIKGSLNAKKTPYFHIFIYTCWSRNKF